VISSVIDELIISLTEKTNTTSVIVTHEMESAFKIATRMAMLYQGKIIQEGSPDELRTSSNPVVHQFVTGTTEGPITETPPHADSSE
jgi:phospholipid/cholesterol/gamma-HCH transport system ATP-binding protein